MVNFKSVLITKVTEILLIVCNERNDESLEQKKTPFHSKRMRKSGQSRLMIAGVIRMSGGRCHRVSGGTENHLDFIPNKGFDGFAFGFPARENDAFRFHLMEQRDQFPQLIKTRSKERAFVFGAGCYENGAVRTGVIGASLIIISPSHSDSFPGVVAKGIE